MNTGSNASDQETTESIINTLQNTEKIILKRTESIQALRKVQNELKTVTYFNNFVDNTTMI